MQQVTQTCALKGVRTSAVRQHVIVMRGRFATQKSPVLDLDIMVEVHVNIKE